ncbi:hypothetical protein DFR24_4850 [Panacagrimonas perspica]|uniref:Uncharacterized protein n=1 Tax=Panacagrimonas perspica TaxID=381431 RepID=A0A4R7NQT0_9GAMM|nr:hypothetical protein [Panacagrimonas perspica]TDU23324.1 hypothetical protein DFR24_4850 [Panacagrimonas perspica]THD00689.1 hypothetical protein B1810_23705 [Panacagrimonas perspica]
MNPTSIIESAKENVAAGRSKVTLVLSHGQDLVQSGTQTLHCAKDVLLGAGHDIKKVVVRTKDELRRTLQEGRERLHHKLTNIATPTRKEAAAARKVDVKAKKQRKRDAEVNEGPDVDPASPLPA